MNHFFRHLATAGVIAAGLHSSLAAAQTVTKQSTAPFGVESLQTLDDDMLARIIFSEDSTLVLSYSTFDTEPQHQMIIQMDSAAWRHSLGMGMIRAVLQVSSGDPAYVDAGATP